MDTKPKSLRLGDRKQAIDVEFVRRRGVLRLSGHYEHIQVLEPREISLGEFLGKLGIGPQDAPWGPHRNGEVSDGDEFVSRDSREDGRRVRVEDVKDGVALVRRVTDGRIDPDDRTTRIAVKHLLGSKWKRADG